MFMLYVSILLSMLLSMFMLSMFLAAAAVEAAPDGARVGEVNIMISVTPQACMNVHPASIQ